MAGIAKPSSSPLSASKNGAIVSEDSHKAEPEKSDEQLYKDAIAKAEREHTAAREEVIAAKIVSAQNSSKDSSAGKRRREFRSELESIRQHQSGFRSSRRSIQEKIAELDSQLKSHTAEQNAARSRVSFNFDVAQKGIEDVKSQIRELDKSLDDPKAEALYRRSDEINQELAKIEVWSDEVLRLRANQREKYSALKAIKDEYYQARTAYRDYEPEQRLQRADRQKAERDVYPKDNPSVRVIEGFSKVGIDPPMNQAGVPEAVKNLKQKRDQWKKDQPIKTKEVPIASCVSYPKTLSDVQDMQKAQKEIDRLEAEGEGRDVESSRFDPVRDTSSEEFAGNQLDKDVAIGEPSSDEGILANELTEPIIPRQDFGLANQLSSIVYMNQRILLLMTDFEENLRKRYDSSTKFLREASIASSLGLLLMSSDVSDYWNQFWEPSLVSGKTRIRWTCQCGKMLWDDFEELLPGAAENLRRDLDSFKGASLGQPHGLTTQAAGSNSPQIPPPVYAPASNSASTVLASVLGTSSGSNPGTSLGSITGGATASAASPGSTSTVEKGNFLLLCSSKPNDTLRLSQLDVGNINDDVRLFRRLNEVYTENRGKWTRFFSLRKIKAINFRKFERHPRERVVICFCPNIHDILPWPTNPRACHPQHSPPGCNTAYDIEPIPPDLSPYVGRNGLHHLLKHPHQAAEEGNNLPIQNVWLKRFPKKKTKLQSCPKYQYGLGWGIEFEEGWDMTRVKAVISVWMLAAIVFLACWWAIHGDVQGATGMASLLLGFPALVITASSLRELEMAHQS